LRITGSQLELIILTLFLLPFSETPFAAGANSAMPGVRNAHAMAYDSSRGRVVLFGGADASKVRGDTWEWDGSRWEQVNNSGPAPRTFPAMAYDNRRKRVVLFGGNRVLFGKAVADNQFLADTWEWDGKKWVESKAAGPPPRAEASMAFDSSRSRIILFGGYNRTGANVNRLGDTWEWDGRVWMEMKVSGPAPRSGAAQAYDSSRRETVLFGGQRTNSTETWEWNGARWALNDKATTLGRFNCAMAFDPVRRRVIRFGGYYDGARFGDTWEYDGVTWQLLTSDGPAPRNHTAMVYDSKRKRTVLFGGHDGENVFGDTWEWDGRTWLQKHSIKSEKRIENGH
jgi:hypothetical protein